MAMKKRVCNKKEGAQDGAEMTLTPQGKLGVCQSGDLGGHLALCDTGHMVGTFSRCDS